MSTFDIIKKTHFVVVTIFFLIYLIKTILLLANKKENLQSFTKKIKLVEIIVSVLFLVTGIYLMFYIPVIDWRLILKISIVFMSIPLAVVGFKKENKGLALLSFLLITAAFGIGEIMKNKKADTTNSINKDGSLNAQQLYVNNCTLCHGSDGKAGINAASDLSTTKLNADSISQIILNGRNTMGKITGLTPEERAAIAHYVMDNIKAK